MENYSIALDTENKPKIQFNTDTDFLTENNRYGYVYRTVNEVNGKIYVGQHSGKFNKLYTGSGDQIIPAVKKYGRSNFSVKSVAWANSKLQLDNLEISLIAFYTQIFGKERMYNITKGGEGIGAGHPSARKGGHITLEHRINISNAHKGKKISVDHKRKISEGNRGRIQTEEEKKKRALSMIGHFTSEETRRKIGESHKGLKHTDSAKRKMSLARRGMYRGNLAKPKITPRWTLSEITKQKMSNARKLYWQNIQLNKDRL